MDNNVDLLLFSGSSGLPKFMRRLVLEVRAEIVCYLSREMGISMAEMARRLGVGTSAIAMAIRRKTRKTAGNCGHCELRPRFRPPKAEVFAL